MAGRFHRAIETVARHRRPIAVFRPRHCTISCLVIRSRLVLRAGEEQCEPPYYCCELVSGASILHSCLCPVRSRQLRVKATTSTCRHSSPSAPASALYGYQSPAELELWKYIYSFSMLVGCHHKLGSGSWRCSLARCRSLLVHMRLTPCTQQCLPATVSTITALFIAALRASLWCGPRSAVQQLHSLCVLSCEFFTVLVALAQHRAAQTFFCTLQYLLIAYSYRALSSAP
jgi:hypothetical protein